MSTAIVVGSGPNGLAAAITLARNGMNVTVLEGADSPGGGTRSGEFTLPGLIHDHCSMAHPMGVGSAFLTGSDLHRYGLRWRWPEIDCAHPLDDGTAGVLLRSVEATAQALGADGPRWRQLFAGPSARYPELAEDIMRPLLRVPSRPLTLARFGLPTLLPATSIAALLRTEAGRALWAGIAAHGWRPQNLPLSSAVGLGIVTAGHHDGWPVVEGGTGALSDTLVKVLADWNGKIETGIWVRSVADLPPADVTLFDLAPEAVARILGDRLPPRIARSYHRFRRGPAAFKIGIAVEGPIPWTNPAAGRAGSLHVVGDYTDTVRAEALVNRGQMPDRPFVVVGQQYLADPTRSRGRLHPIDAYAHVPHGYTGDATRVILDQIERFAPGFRDRIAALAVRGPAQLAEYNPNYLGGDIMTGAKNLRQLIFGGARITLRPYGIGVPGMFICSASTPPGPGAHGMCGANAAAAALRYLQHRN